jgi:hypothetical protein
MKIYTRYDNTYLIDYSYKNLKAIEFAKEKEINFCHIILWKNEDRLSVIKFLLSFSHVFSNIGVKKKQVILRYRTKTPKKGKSFLEIMIPIINIQVFLYSLLVCGRAKMKYIFNTKREVISIIYIFSMNGYKFKWAFSENKVLLMSYVYHYIYKIQILTHLIPYSRRKAIKEAFDIKVKILSSRLSRYISHMDKIELYKEKLKKKKKTKGRKKK